MPLCSSEHGHLLNLLATPVTLFQGWHAPPTYMPFDTHKPAESVGHSFPNNIFTCSKGRALHIDSDADPTFSFLRDAFGHYTYNYYVLTKRSCIATDFSNITLAMEVCVDLTSFITTAALSMHGNHSKTRLERWFGRQPGSGCWRGAVEVRTYGTTGLPSLSKEKRTSTSQGRRPQHPPRAHPLRQPALQTYCLPHIHARTAHHWVGLLSSFCS